MLASWQLGIIFWGLLYLFGTFSDFTSLLTLPFPFSIIHLVIFLASVFAHPSVLEHAEAAFLRSHPPPKSSASTSIENHGKCADDRDATDPTLSPQRISSKIIRSSSKRTHGSPVASRNVTPSIWTPIATSSRSRSPGGDLHAEFASKSRSTKTVVGTCSSLYIIAACLRLHVVFDMINAIWTPSYFTLNPPSSSPRACLYDAILKAVPQAIMSACLLHYENQLNFSGLVSFLTAILSIAFGFATYEIGDFKQGLLVPRVSFASAIFLRLLVLRVLELSVRLISLVLLLSVATPLESIPLIALSLSAVVMQATSSRKKAAKLEQTDTSLEETDVTSNPKLASPLQNVSVAYLLAFFVFWDERMAYGRQPLFDPRIFHAIRLMENFGILGRIFLANTKTPDNHAFVVPSMSVLLVLNILYVIFIPTMIRQWSGYKALQQYSSAPVKVMEPKSYQQVTPATKQRALNTTPVHRSLLHELSQSPALRSRRALVSPNHLDQSMRTVVDATPNNLRHHYSLRTESPSLVRSSPLVRRPKTLGFTQPFGTPLRSTSLGMPAKRSGDKKPRPKSSPGVFLHTDQQEPFGLGIPTSPLFESFVLSPSEH